MSLYYVRLNKSKQLADVKPGDSPLGDAGATQHSQRLDTLTTGMTPEEKTAFTTAYSADKNTSGTDADKRLELAKASAGMSAGERDRKVAQDIAAKNRTSSEAIAAQNHKDAQDNINTNRDLESVQYKDKSGNMVSGSFKDARDAGAQDTARKISASEDTANRTVYAQFPRWQNNIGAAASTMKAWDNPQDKDLAVRVLHNVSAGIHTGILNIDSEDLQNAFLNSADYKAMTPAGQAHMQNMYQLWSDAINLMKVETGGVPRGEHFLKLESAILPQPEKTQEQNHISLQQFSNRILQDTKGHVRPNDMDPVTPFDSQGSIENKKTGQKGYRDANGKDVWF
jgi:hypothetical protein